jgi:hypothetical protein
VEVDVRVVEGGFEFESATADVAEVGTEEADGGIIGDGGARLVLLLLVDEDAASEDDGLSAFAGESEATLHEQFVETGFHGRNFMATDINVQISPGLRLAS